MADTLTDSRLKSLKATDKTVDHFFKGGLVVRLFPDNRKQVRYLCMVSGRRLQFNLGDYGRGAGKRTLKQLTSAQGMAKGLRADVVAKLAADIDGYRWAREVIDLQLDRGLTQLKAVDEVNSLRQAEQQVALDRQQADADSSRPTFRKLAGAFLRRPTGRGGKVLAPKTAKEYSLQIDNTLVPEFGDVALEDLDPEAIIEWLQEKAETAPAMANALHTTMNAVFNWGVKNQPGFNQNPIFGTDKPAVKSKKDRALDFDPARDRINNRMPEVKAFWKDSYKMHNSLHGVALRLILLTGCRPSEVLKMQADDIEGDVISLPITHIKNRKGALRIPITPMIKTELDRLGGDVLFPDTNGNPITNSELSKSVRRARINKLFKFATWSPHDLRRTAASHIKQLGFAEYEIDLELLNHTLPGSAGTYIKGDSLARKTDMLTAWHGVIEKFDKTKTDNVARLRA